MFPISWGMPPQFDNYLHIVSENSHYNELNWFLWYVTRYKLQYFYIWLKIKLQVIVPVIFSLTWFRDSLMMDWPIIKITWSYNYLILIIKGPTLTNEIQSYIKTTKTCNYWIIRFYIKITAWFIIITMVFQFAFINVQLPKPNFIAIVSSETVLKC